MTRPTALLFALLATSPVLAVEIDGHQVAVELQGFRLNDTANVGGRSLVINGAGTRMRMFNNDYVVSLYLPQKVAKAELALAGGTKRIQLNMVRAMTGASLRAELDKGMKSNNTTEQLTMIRPEREQLAKIMKSVGKVRPDDVVTFDFVEGATTVTVNGEDKGHIKGEVFNQALLRSWIGNKPLQPDLKKDLLNL